MLLVFLLASISNSNTCDCLTPAKNMLLNKEINTIAKLLVISLQGH